MMYEGYDKDIVRNDIVIFILNECVMFNSFVMFICLFGFFLSFLLNYYFYFNYVYGIVVGWGDIRGKIWGEREW